MKNNLVLIGLRGVGKTTLARTIAEKYKIPMIDTDRELEKWHHVSVSALHGEVGEERFRALEREVIEGLVGSDGNVIATGGGVCICERNREILQSLGVVVCLHMEEEALKARWEELPHYKPWIGDFHTWFEERVGYLKKIDAHWIDPRNEDVVCRVIALGKFLP